MADAPYFPLEDFTIVRTPTSIDIVGTANSVHEFWARVFNMFARRQPGNNMTQFQDYSFVSQTDPTHVQTYWVAQVLTETALTPYRVAILAQVRDYDHTLGTGGMPIPAYVAPPSPGDVHNPAHEFVQKAPHRPGNKNKPSRRFPLFSTGL